MRLDGCRVLDLTRLLPGPYATQLLCDAGADVIKVEDTGQGDYARDIPPYSDRGVGALFDAVNRGKRSVAIDLKSEAGRETFYALVADCDVLIEGFRPGVAERLGIDYDTLAEHDAELVYCSLTGFGRTGPDAQRVGHDLNYVGRAGLLDTTRNGEREPPRIPGYPIADMAGGLFAAFSILGALLSRELGNTDGEHVDVSMTDVVLSFSQPVSSGIVAGEDTHGGESSLTGGLPWYDVYETADERYVTLAALEPKFWKAFCETIGREDLIEIHGSDDPDVQAALREELTAIFAGRSRAEWEEELRDVPAMVGPVNTPREALSDPQIEAREVVSHPAEAPPRVGFPARSTEEPAAGEESIPDRGEQTESVLHEHGFEESEIDDLRASGAIE
ncbi:CoA transferase [Halobacteriales archaeon QS_3_64_16]|nr:MAG: CoA transferase [Halobacteriales archaeon QS_3_64_16]